MFNYQIIDSSHDKSAIFRYIQKTGQTHVYTYIANKNLHSSDFVFTTKYFDSYK